MTDEELIERWKKKKDYSAYQQLKNRHKGMVFQSVHRYNASSVPSAALEAEAWSLFDDAVNNYKPSSNAKFSTYLSYNTRKLDRYTKKHQNIARIPESLSARIGDYDRTHQTLRTELKREPTVKEMSKTLKMPVKHINQLNRSRRQDLFEGKYEGTPVGGTDVKETGDWLLVEMRQELNPQEQQVYDYLIGYKKQKITNKKILAQKLGMSPGRISQITNSIATKLKPHLNKRL